MGGVAGGLAGLGVPVSEAHGYQERLKEGRTQLSLHSGSSEWTKRAKKILESTGSQDISSTGEASEDFDQADRLVRRSA